MVINVKKTFKLIAVVFVMIIMSSCNAPDVYSNSAFKELKTFNEITGMENVEEETCVYFSRYTYTLFENAEEKILKYQEYLVNEYGFNYVADESEEGKSCFEYENLNDSQLKMFWENISNGIILTIYVPYDEQTKAVQEEQEYIRITELLAEEKYDSILKSELKQDYKDTQKILNYCRGMMCMNIGGTASAIDWFLSADGYLDSRKYIEEINSIILPENGVYYADNSDYPGYGIGYYIFVKDGMVAMELESSYSESGEVYYDSELIKVPMTEENIEKLQGSVKENEVNSEAWFFTIGDVYYNMGKVERNYTFIEVEGGSKFVAPAFEGGYDTFMGIYEKIGDSVSG